MEWTEVKDSMPEEDILKLLVEISDENCNPEWFRRKEGKPSQIKYESEHRSEGFMCMTSFHPLFYKILSNFLSFDVNNLGNKFCLEVRMPFFLLSSWHLRGAQVTSW